jgi:hypothetical protein
MSDNDGIDSSTRVPVARHAWAPAVMSCLVPTLGSLAPY